MSGLVLQGPVGFASLVPVEQNPTGVFHEDTVHK